MLDIGQIHRKEYELEIQPKLTKKSSSANDDLKTNIVAIGESPGRIHFMGEQGEPESGCYLSAAIDRFINVAVSMRKDNSFRFFAADLGERKRSTLVNLKYRREDRWANCIKPAIHLFMELGFPVKGLNFSFCGDIPQGIGLASSTAIETAAAMALKNLFHAQISEMELAQKLMESHEELFSEAAVREAVFADYAVCMLARKDHFVIIDSLTGDVKLTKSPLSRFRILLVDSRVPRMGAEGELALRREDVLKGLKLLSKKKQGAAFKDFASADLLEVLGNFPERIRRRTMHIVEEIHRIDDAVDSLERSDIASFAKIIYRSHESLRDLYEISCPEVDWLVKRAQEIEGAAGSRMTGLGFGGCTYTIIRRELVEEYKKRMEEYERIFGFRPVTYEVKLATRARVK